MNTKWIMVFSAFLLALIGIAFTFFGAELAVFTGTGLSVTFQLLLQLLGALYFGFAMLNCMAKGAVMGGIYNRPIAIANFAHFFIGGMALVKAVINHPGISYAIWALAFLYTLFALLFGYVLFRNPVMKQPLHS
jgi:hypothetical protein